MSKVLVVEDDSDIALALRVVLERSGHDVTQARSGPAAVEAFAAGGPELVVLDVGLPEVDGWGVLSHIRALLERAAP